MERNSGGWGRHRSVWKRFAAHRMALLGAFLMLLFTLMAIFAPWLMPYDPLQINLAQSKQGPNAIHWLGTDALGRDILSRLILGSRYTLGYTFLGVLAGTVLGTILGAIAGYYGSVVDNLLMRCMDLLLAFPGILLTIVIITITGTGMQGVVIAIGVYTIPELSRIVRSSVLSLKETEYIIAAQALGSSDRRIIFRHILLNALSPVLVYSTLRLARAILIASALSFLGMGAKPPTPEWGAMLSTGRSYIRVAPHITIFPGLAIMLAVMAVNLVGDGLRDFLDPRLKHS